MPVVYCRDAKAVQEGGVMAKTRRNKRANGVDLARLPKGEVLVSDLIGVSNVNELLEDMEKVKFEICQAVVMYTTKDGNFYIRRNISKENAIFMCDIARTTLIAQHIKEHYPVYDDGEEYDDEEMQQS